MTLAQTITTVHALNIGYAEVKAVTLTSDGAETSVVFPSLVAPARGTDSDLGGIMTVEIDGHQYWTGSDALLGNEAQSLLGQQRLFDLAFIPALTKAALKRLGATVGGQGVSGLPAAWATRRELAVALGQRLRAGVQDGFFSGIKVLAEPQGGIYSLLLDAKGDIATNSKYTGRVGVIDWGHHTVDIATVEKLTVVATSLQSFNMGTAKPLQRIQASISAQYGRDLALHQVDEAIRTGLVKVAGQDLPLPTSWDKPLIENARTVAARIADAWGGGLDLDVVVVLGGGAELEVVAEALRTTFPHSVVPGEPQLAIARGYARWGMRVARGLA